MHFLVPKNLFLRENSSDFSPDDQSANDSEWNSQRCKSQHFTIKPLNLICFGKQNDSLSSVPDNSHLS